MQPDDFEDEDSGPPELPEEDLQRLDDEAEAEELRRLVEMKVLRETDVIPERTSS